MLLQWSKKKFQVFMWVDARWTPRAAMDLSLTKKQLAEEMNKPWPHGVRVVKDLQVQPSASSSVEGHACAANAAWRGAASPSPSQIRTWSVCALPGAVSQSREVSMNFLCPVLFSFVFLRSRPYASALRRAHGCYMSHARTHTNNLCKDRLLRHVLLLIISCFGYQPCVRKGCLAYVQQLCH